MQSCRDHLCKFVCIGRRPISCVVAESFGKRVQLNVQGIWLCTSWSTVNLPLGVFRNARCCSHFLEPLKSIFQVTMVWIESSRVRWQPLPALRGRGSSNIVEHNFWLLWRIEAQFCCCSTRVGIQFVGTRPITILSSTKTNISNSGCLICWNVSAR